MRRNVLIITCILSSLLYATPPTDDDANITSTTIPEFEIATTSDSESEEISTTPRYAMGDKITCYENNRYSYRGYHDPNYADDPLYIAAGGEGDVCDHTDPIYGGIRDTCYFQVVLGDETWTYKCMHHNSCPKKDEFGEGMMGCVNNSKRITCCCNEDMCNGPQYVGYADLGYKQYVKPNCWKGNKKEKEITGPDFNETSSDEDEDEYEEEGCDACFFSVKTGQSEWRRSCVEHTKCPLGDNIMGCGAEDGSVDCCCYGDYCNSYDNYAEIGEPSANESPTIEECDLSELIRPCACFTTEDECKDAQTRCYRTECEWFKERGSAGFCQEIEGMEAPLSSTIEPVAETTYPPLSMSTTEINVETTSKEEEEEEEEESEESEEEEVYKARDTTETPAVETTVIETTGAETTAEEEESPEEPKETFPNIPAEFLPPCGGILFHSCPMGYECTVERWGPDQPVEDMYNVGECVRVQI